MSRLRLDSDAYARLRQAVLSRDGWRCQYCGRRSQLEVHHLHYRSQQGADAEENLISLCAVCHKEWHESSRHQAG